ncbi:MAG: carboxypeptidase regulatory-like domain-containing protein, partial [Gammaproteobacteria bacterium]
MAHTTVIRVFIIGWLMTWAFPSTAGISEGIQYLSSQAQTDGRIVSGVSIATSYQNTSEALTTLIDLNGSEQQTWFPGLQFLQQEFDAFQNTENLSRLIIAKAEQGQINTVLIGQLQSYQNSDGGFGEFPGYGSTALDTAFALKAFELTGRSTTQTALQALSYLLNVQNGNGGWSVSSNASQSYVTALCLEALSPYALSYQDVPAAVSQGETFLFSQQAVDGLWLEDFQSAVVLHALMASGTDKSGLEQSVNTLSARQSSDGSWQNDVYTTALVLRALYRYQAGSGGVVTTGSGSAIGTVVLSGSGEPIVGATVALASQPGLSVLSDADGNFRLTGLPAGSLTLSVTKAGYLGASSIVPVFSGQQSNAGNIALAVDAQTGLVRAGITDGLDQSVLAGVSVALSGPQVYQGSTDANGTLEFAAVLPGSYALSLDKTGYQSLTGQVTVVAGGIVNIKQSLLRTGAYLDTNPGDVFGRIVDGLTGVPLAGAQFTLNTGATAIADNQGQFTFAALPRGAYEGQLAAEGYQGQTLSFDFAPGVVGSLGDLRLYPLGQVTAATSLTLLGQVVDGVGGQAIPGATVQFATQTVAADSQGNFVLSDITQLTFNLNIAADGYQSLSFAMTASGFGEVQQS